jgi:hypothetical protein
MINGVNIFCHLYVSHHCDSIAFEDIYDDTWPLLIRGLAGAWPAMNWTKAQLAEEFGTELVMVRRMEDGEASGDMNNHWLCQ